MAGLARVSLDVDGRRPLAEQPIVSHISGLDVGLPNVACIEEFRFAQVTARRADDRDTDWGVPITGGPCVT